MGHGERLEQLDAVQLRHRDVRQDEIHRKSWAEGGEGLRTIRGLAGAVPALSQASGRPAAGHWARRPPRGLAPFFGATSRRQPHVAVFLFQVDTAAALGNDAPREAMVQDPLAVRRAPTHSRGIASGMAIIPASSSHLRVARCAQALGGLGLQIVQHLPPRVVALSRRDSLRPLPPVSARERP
jgi:hypothetical protein